METAVVRRACGDGGPSKNLLQFFLERRQALWNLASVVVCHAALPLEEVSDRLGLNSDLHSAEAGDQQFHLGEQPQLSALVLRAGLHDHLDVTPTRFEKAPATHHFFGSEQSLGRQVKALATHAGLRSLTDSFFLVSQKVGARNFAFDYDGTAVAAPTNEIGNLSGIDRLFAQHNAAAVGTKPSLGKFDQLLMGHGRVLRLCRLGRK